MENVFFKQSLRGFDRRQVLEYIDGLSRQMSRQADEYSRRQEKLENEIKDLSDSLRHKSDSLNISNEKLSRLAEELNGLKQTNSELKRQVAGYRNMLLERDRQMSRIKAEYNELSRQSRRLKEENRHWKSRQDDIAVCMVEAQARARRIVDKANAQARRTKAQFDANAAGLMEKVADMKGEISRLEKQLESSFSRLNTAMKSMDEAQRVIEEQVSSYRKKVDDLDRFSIRKDAKEPPAPKRNSRPSQKKNLTDSVLDTISKLLER